MRMMVMPRRRPAAGGGAIGGSLDFHDDDETYSTTHTFSSLSFNANAILCVGHNAGDVSDITVDGTSVNSTEITPNGTYDISFFEHDGSSGTYDVVITMNNSNRRVCLGVVNLDAAPGSIVTLGSEVDQQGGGRYIDLDGNTNSGDLIIAQASHINASATHDFTVDSTTYVEGTDSEISTFNYDSSIDHDICIVSDVGAGTPLTIQSDCGADWKMHTGQAIAVRA